MCKLSYDYGIRKSRGYTHSKKAEGVRRMKSITSTTALPTDTSHITPLAPAGYFARGGGHEVCVRLMFKLIKDRPKDVSSYVETQTTPHVKLLVILICCISVWCISFALQS
jgi:hypothetical protein